MGVLLQLYASLRGIQLNLGGRQRNKKGKVATFAASIPEVQARATSVQDRDVVYVRLEHSSTAANSPIQTLKEVIHHSGYSPTWLRPSILM